MNEMFPIVDTTTWSILDEEAMGTKAKSWLSSPVDESSWLFKHTRRSDEKAEDWPEKIAAEMAEYLEIPAARVELASHHDSPGTISRDITQGRRLDHGNELLYRHDPTYERDKRRPRHGYTIAAVSNALTNCFPPPGFSPSSFTAYEVFAGYLAFDALIANQDRHHQNWGILVDDDGNRWLAPSFDHASSLGFMLSDDDRDARLNTRDKNYAVSHWAHRGKSRFAGEPPLVDLAQKALRACSQQAIQRWCEKLVALESEIDTFFDPMPRERMSTVAGAFAREVVLVNQRRLLYACNAVVA